MLIWDRVLISFLRNIKSLKQNFNIYLKRNNNRNYNSNKYTVNVQLDRILIYFDADSFDSVTYINQ